MQLSLRKNCYEQGADVNAEREYTQSIAHDNTEMLHGRKPLECALEMQSPDAIELLMIHYAESHKIFIPALHTAAQNNRLENIQALMAYGIPWYERNTDNTLFYQVTDNETIHTFYRDTFYCLRYNTA